MPAGTVPGWAGAYIIAVEFISAITAVLAIYAWRNREEPGAKGLTALFIGVSIWCLMAVLRIIAEPLWLSRLFDPVMFFAIGLNTSGWVAFTIVFTNNEQYLNWFTRGLLGGHPIALLLVTSLTPGLFWGEIRQVPASEHLTGYIAEPGILFGVHAIYTYVLFTLSFGLLIQHVIKSRSVYWQQGLAVTVGGTFTTVANLVYLFGFVPIDPTPIAYGLTGTCFAWAIFSYRLMDLTPVARERIVDSISDAVFVLDQKDRVTDLNAPAQQLLSIEEADAIGTHANTVFGEYPGLYDRYEDVVETEDEIELASGGETRIFELEIAPIYDTHDRVISRLFIFHDITEERLRQADLEKQNEQLERFASVVSHDLRNPINVARGYVDVAIETDEVSHLEEAQVSFDRMEAIIDDVLTMARDGTRIEETEPVELEPVAREAWSHVETDAATLDVEESITFQADEKRLQRVLENLIRNAIDHGDGELTIRVGAHTVDDGVFTEAAASGFYVADDGPGIPPDKRDDVLESGYTTAEDGTGLGLSIVQSIAESHGWDVQVAESWASGARIEICDVVPIEPVEA